MSKLKIGSNIGSDTLTRDPTRPGQNRWPGDPWPGNPVPSLHSWPFDPAQALAVRIWCDRNAARLAPLLPHRPDHCSSRWVNTYRQLLICRLASLKGFVLGPLLFAAYCSVVADVVASHGMWYHQYTDDTLQLHLAMHAGNTADGLSCILSACTDDVRQWYLVNLQNMYCLSLAQPAQVRATSRRQRKPAAGDCISHTHTVCCRVKLPAADQMKVLRVELDRRLTFHKHLYAALRSCNYHAHPSGPIDRSQTLASSLILSRIDYCNALLHGAPASNIRKKLERVQSIATRIVLQAPRRSDSKRLLRQLHWLPVRQRITYNADVQDPPHIDTCDLPTSAVSLSRDCRRRLLCVRLQFRCCLCPSPTGWISQDMHFAACTAPPPGTLCHTLWLLQLIVNS